MTKREREARLQTFEREALSHLDGLLRTAARVVRSAPEAEDVVQETYLRAWKHRERLTAFHSGSFNVASVSQSGMDLLVVTSLAEEEASSITRAIASRL